MRKEAMVANMLTLISLQLILCQAQLPDASKHSAPVSIDAVRSWLSLNSIEFELEVRRGIPPTSPHMEIDEWISKGRKIPEIDKSLEYLLATRNASVELPYVALALGFLGDEESVSVLAGCLGSDDVSLRLFSAGALGRLPLATDSIVAIGTKYRTETDSNVRANLLVALARSRQQSAEKYLREGIHDTNEFVRSCLIDELLVQIRKGKKSDQAQNSPADE